MEDDDVPRQRQQHARTANRQGVAGVSGMNPFEVGLEPRAANHAPLTPLVFLDWCADVYPDRLAVVHGRRRYTWAQTARRCRKVANAL